MPEHDLSEYSWLGTDRDLAFAKRNSVNQQEGRAGYLCSDANALVNPVHQALDEGAPRRPICPARAELTGQSSNASPQRGLGGWVVFFFLESESKIQGRAPILFF